MTEESFQEFGRAVEGTAPLSAKKTPSRARNIAKQAAIGAAEGAIGTPGDVLSLVGLNSPGALPGEQARYEREFENPELMPFLTEDDLAPGGGGIPTSESIRKLLSLFGVKTEPEGVVERVARRAGANVGAGALTGAGAAGIAGLGAAAVPGQLVEEVAGPWAGLGAELLSLLAPGAFAKTLVPSKAKQPLLESAKRVGIEEKNLAPLLKGEKTVRSAGKFAKKGRRAQKVLSDIQEGLGEGYEVLKNSPEMKVPLSPGETKNITRQIEKVQKKLGKSLKGTDKEKVIEAVADLRSKVEGGRLNAADLVDYYQEINAQINWNAVKGGKKRLAEVKEALVKGIKDASPEVAKDFQSLNTLYSNYKNLEKTLNPGRLQDIIDLSKGLEILGPIIRGNFSALMSGVKLATGTELAQRGLLRYLTSPRTNNMLKKAFNLTNEGKIAQAQIILRKLEKEAEAHRQSSNMKPSISGTKNAP